MGLEDGGLLLLATEDGEVLARARPFSQPCGPTGAGAAEAGALAVAAIAWTQQAAGLGEAGLNGAPVGLPGPTDPCWAPSGGLLEDRARRLFRPPPPQPGLPGSSAAGPASGYAGLPPAGGAAEAAARGGAWPPQPSSLALLAGASAGGQLVLCSGGLFRLAAVDLPTVLGAPDARVMQASVNNRPACWMLALSLSHSRLVLGAAIQHWPEGVQLHKRACGVLSCDWYSVRRSWRLCCRCCAAAACRAEEPARTDCVLGAGERLWRARCAGCLCSTATLLLLRFGSRSQLVLGSCSVCACMRRWADCV